MSRFWPAHDDIGGVQANRGEQRQPSATMQVSVSPAAVWHHRPWRGGSAGDGLSSIDVQHSITPSMQR